MKARLESGEDFHRPSTSPRILRPGHEEDIDKDTSSRRPLSKKEDVVFDGYSAALNHVKNPIVTPRPLQTSRTVEVRAGLPSSASSLTTKPEPPGRTAALREAAVMGANDGGVSTPEWYPVPTFSVATVGCRRGRLLLSV